MIVDLDLTWGDIALRLAFTVVAGALIGIDREVRGHAAGLRTTILVALAAAVSMVLANILLAETGRTPSSFSSMDVMRLPLGVLTGVGFIGGGAILRRGDVLSGVTTAATLWIATMIGLCMGIGQISLGCLTTALALATLWGLRAFNERMPHVHRSRLVIATGTHELKLPDVAAMLGKEFDIRFLQLAEVADGERLATFEVRWTRADDDLPPAELLARLAGHCEVRSLEMV